MKRNWILKYSIPATFAIVSFAAMPVAAEVAALDGRVFVADAGERDHVVLLVGGKFHSSACDQYGFSKGDYRANGAGDSVTFEAETQSEKDGRLVWKGTVRGADIEGTFVHYRKGWLLNPNPEPVEHWFQGRVKT